MTEITINWAAVSIQDEGVKNIMIMGDMNAGGSSAPIAILNNVESELPKFKWLIGE